MIVRGGIGRIPTAFGRLRRRYELAGILAHEGAAAHWVHRPHAPTAAIGGPKDAKCRAHAIANDAVAARRTAAAILSAFNNWPLDAVFERSQPPVRVVRQSTSKVKALAELRVGAALAIATLRRRSSKPLVVTNALANIFGRGQILPAGSRINYYRKWFGAQ